MDLVGELNFFSLFSSICLNNISSYIGPIIADDINNNSVFELEIGWGEISLNSVILNRHDIDIPKLIR